METKFPQLSMPDYSWASEAVARDPDLPFAYIIGYVGDKKVTRDMELDEILAECPPTHSAKCELQSLRNEVESEKRKFVRETTANLLRRVSLDNTDATYHEYIKTAKKRALQIWEAANDIR